MLGLAVGREVLTQRIRIRYRRQMAAGLLDEVRALSERPEGWSRTAREALGYRELAAHLRGECALDEAVADGRLSPLRLESFRRMERVWTGPDY